MLNEFVMMVGVIQYTMIQLLIIVLLSLFIIGLNLTLIASARRANMRMQRARIKSNDKNRPLFENRRNINKGWDDYNYKDDYYKK